MKAASDAPACAPESPAWRSRGHLSVAKLRRSRHTVDFSTTLSGRAGVDVGAELAYAQGVAAPDGLFRRLAHPLA